MSDVTATQKHIHAAEDKFLKRTSILETEAAKHVNEPFWLIFSFSGFDDLGSTVSIK